MNSATFGITLSKLIESKLYEFQHHVEQNPKNILFFGVFAMESKNKYFILDNWQKKKKKSHYYNHGVAVHSSIANDIVWIP